MRPPTDLGATGVEILADTHIPDYPNPSTRWIDEWHRLVAGYGLTPTCYSSWLDTRLNKGRALMLDEATAILLRDLELAHRLGFRFRLHRGELPGRPDIVKIAQ